MKYAAKVRLVRGIDALRTSKPASARSPMAIPSSDIPESSGPSRPAYLRVFLAPPGNESASSSRVATPRNDRPDVAPRKASRTRHAVPTRQSSVVHKKLKASRRSASAGATFAAVPGSSTLSQTKRFSAGGSATATQSRSVSPNCHAHCIPELPIPHRPSSGPSRTATPRDCPTRVVPRGLSLTELNSMDAVIFGGGGKVRLLHYCQATDPLPSVYPGGAIDLALRADGEKSEKSSSEGVRQMSLAVLSLPAASFEPVVVELAPSACAVVNPTTKHVVCRLPWAVFTGIVLFGPSTIAEVSATDHVKAPVDAGLGAVGVDDEPSKLPEGSAPGVAGCGGVRLTGDRGLELAFLITDPNRRCAFYKIAILRMRGSVPKLPRYPPSLASILSSRSGPSKPSSERGGSANLPPTFVSSGAVRTNVRSLSLGAVRPARPLAAPHHALPIPVQTNRTVRMRMEELAKARASGRAEGSAPSKETSPSRRVPLVPRVAMLSAKAAAAVPRAVPEVATWIPSKPLSSPPKPPRSPVRTASSTAGKASTGTVSPISLFSARTTLSPRSGLQTTIKHSASSSISPDRPTADMFLDIDCSPQPAPVLITHALSTTTKGKRLQDERSVCVVPSSILQDEAHPLMAPTTVCPPPEATVERSELTAGSAGEELPPAQMAPPARGAGDRSKPSAAAARPTPDTDRALSDLQAQYEAERAAMEAFSKRLRIEREDRARRAQAEQSAVETEGPTSPQAEVEDVDAVDGLRTAEEDFEPFVLPSDDEEDQRPGDDEENFCLDGSDFSDAA